MTPNERIADLEARLDALKQKYSDEVNAGLASEREIQRLAVITEELAGLVVKAEARLAMAVEAAKLAVSEECSLCMSPGERALRDATNASAPTIAAFLARIEAQGAAKELRRAPQLSYHTIDLYGGIGGASKRTVLCVLVSDLLARAAELEGR